jgi:integrase
LVIGTQPVLAASSPPALDDLVDDARRYANANRAASTQRAYASDWAQFTAWARTHGLDAMPADPATVALYITALAETHRPSTINRRLAAIAVAHHRHGLASPTQDPGVREIAKGIRRSLGTAQREAAPATIGDLRRMIAHLPHTVAGVRDRALLLVGFAAAMRRSELVALDVADLDERDEGIAVTIRSSKTDQESRGRRVALPFGRDPETCPVRALRAWRGDADIADGPIFRAVDRHGRVHADRLSDRAVALVVKRAAAAAGLEPDRYTGHSLRAGFATTAASNGASERSIAAQTGHRSMEVLRRYIREGSLFADNAVNSLGL